MALPRREDMLWEAELALTSQLIIGGCVKSCTYLKCYSYLSIRVIASEEILMCVSFIHREKDKLVM